MLTNGKTLNIRAAKIKGFTVSKCMAEFYPEEGATHVVKQS